MNARIRELVASPNSQFTTTNPGDVTRDIVQSTPPLRKNVMLVTIESLSANFMAHFGNRNDLTPNLDALADQSVFFTQICWPPAHARCEDLRPSRSRCRRRRDSRSCGGRETRSCFHSDRCCAIIGYRHDLSLRRRWLFRQHERLFRQQWIQGCRSEAVCVF